MAKKGRKRKKILTIYYQNVNGLRTEEKQRQFQKNVRINNYDVICLTETNLKEKFSNSLFFDNRYIIFRRDRNLQPTWDNPNPKKSGGGVLIAVKEFLYPERLILHNVSGLGEAEDVWVTINLANGKKINICCAYIPGYSGKQMVAHLKSIIENRIMLKNTILVGDYNIPEVNFNSENVPNDILKMKKKAFKKMAKFIHDARLQQRNYSKNENNVTLDLVLSYMDIEVIDACPLVRIDVHHPPILILIEDDDSDDDSDKLDLDTEILRLVIDDMSFTLAAPVAYRCSCCYLKKEENKKRMKRAQMFEKTLAENEARERAIRATRERERKQNEERDRKAAEKKKQEEKERERRNNNNGNNYDNHDYDNNDDSDDGDSDRDRDNSTAVAAGSVAVGVAVGVGVGVGIILLCPTLTPVAPKVAVKCAVITTAATACVVGLLFLKK